MSIYDCLKWATIEKYFFEVSGPTLIKMYRVLHRYDGCACDSEVG